MFTMVLGAILATTTIFWALTLMAKAQIVAMRYLSVAFLATVGFAKLVWRYFRSFFMKVRNSLAKKKTK
ncbi:hypothetical protein J2Z60_000521 [Lactobacillus colini]|uniref:Uncharacterized protein n=1 Tax=Lactobacillus colini TaxID=1819254 RepID=A0ABS4MCE2_9LACO|nr:hypothetical protein [Lactobacillus colini]MBP2057357.1 hypothetical protein [Lactobacillus colini]